MLCQNCKKREATVNHVQSVGGKTCAVHLCALCANELFGEFEKTMQSHLFGGLFDTVYEERRCPSCGLTFSEYKRSGLLGCPSCYDVFHEELLPYIARIQGKTEHVGKKGGENTAEHNLLIELSALQRQMDDALARGDAIEAGRINARMNALKKRPADGSWRW